MAEYRTYGIPADSVTKWNPDIHGKPYDDDNFETLEDSVVPVTWTPGRYEFDYAACGHSFVILVPELEDAREPNQKILEGFHEFLKVALDG